MLIRELLGLTIESVIHETDRQLGLYDIKTLDDVRSAPTKLVCTEASAAHPNSPNSNTFCTKISTTTTGRFV